MINYLVSVIKVRIIWTQAMLFGKMQVENYFNQRSISWMFCYKGNK